MRRPIEPPRGRARALRVLAAAVLLVACESAEVELTVDLRTDLVPGRELVEVRTRAVRADDASRARGEVARVAVGANALRGIRVAELDDMGGATWRVEAELFDADGGRVGLGRVLVDVADASRGVTVVVTRDCAAVACGDGETCVDGACVDARCSPESPGDCPARCGVDAECEPDGASCVVGRCLDGVCFDVPDEARCAAGACDPVEGCVGEPGDAGTDAGPPTVPLAGVRALGLGDRHTCADLGGELRCWGANDVGQLGDGTTVASARPSSVVLVSGSGLAVGPVNACVERGGLPSCWGDNARAQLGRASPAFSASPLEVENTDAIGGPFALGRAHACASRRTTCVSPGPCENEHWCWGANDSGQLGDGTRTDRVGPARLDVRWQVVSAGAGDAHTCVVSLEGGPARDLLCWGANGSGQLGDGTLTDRLVPVVAISSGATRVDAGAAHTCALVGAEVRCWGDNARGQVGGADQPQTTPFVVSGLAASDVCAGGSHSCAVRDDGAVVCWGANGDGQLGDGTTADRSTPVVVPGLAGAVDVACGLAHTCAALDDETARCWGRNEDGQLGDGTTEPRLSPVTVVAP